MSSKQSTTPPSSGESSQPGDQFLYTLFQGEGPIQRVGREGRFRKPGLEIARKDLLKFIPLHEVRPFM